MIKVLHVDDSRDDLELTRYQLKRMTDDLQIRWAESASQALGMLENEALDLILSDYQMPEQDGLQLLRMLRNRGKTIPFIFLTGQGNEEIAAEALRAGADDYFTKEAGFAHYLRLINSIHRVVESRQQRQRHSEAEEALIESQRTLSTLMSNLPGMAFRCRNDREWTMEFVSEGCFELTGYGPLDLVGNKNVSYVHLIHPDDREPVRSEIQAAVAAKRSFKLTYRITTASGDTRFVWVQGRGIFSCEGDLRALEGFVEDVTDHRMADEKVDHLNRVLSAIRNVNQIIVREKNLQPLLKGVCENLIETRGYKAAWIALLNDSGAAEETTEAGLGKEFIPIDEKLRNGKLPECGNKALKQSEVFVTKSPNVECRSCPLSHDANEAVICSRLEYDKKVFGLLSVTIPAHLCEEQEELLLLKEVSDDIAYALRALHLEEERKQAEEALMQNEQLMKATVESTADGVLVANNDGLILHSNNRFAEMWQAPVELIDAKDEEKLLMHSLEQLREPEAFLHRVMNLRASNKESVETHQLNDGRYFDILSIPLSQDGVITGRVWNFRDVTKHKRAELILDAIYNVAREAVLANSVRELLRGVHESLKPVLDSSHFCVALQDQGDVLDCVYSTYKEGKSNHEVVWNSKSLATYVFRSGIELLADETVIRELMGKGSIDVSGQLPACWLGVPLKSSKRIFGVAILQNFSNGAAFGGDDLKLLRCISGQIASAIERLNALRA